MGCCLDGGGDFLDLIRWDGLDSVGLAGYRPKTTPSRRGTLDDNKNNLILSYLMVSILYQSYLNVRSTIQIQKIFNQSYF